VGLDGVGPFEGRCLALSSCSSDSSSTLAVVPWGNPFAFGLVGVVSCGSSMGSVGRPMVSILSTLFEVMEFALDFCNATLRCLASRLTRSLDSKVRSISA
jgi:hypothetical protein